MYSCGKKSNLMDPHFHNLLIPMIILALLLINSADASNLEHAIQHRLFNRFIDDLNSDPSVPNENVFDEISHESNPKLRLLEDLLKVRQSLQSVANAYDEPNTFQQNSDIVVESNLPYGVRISNPENRRSPRSKSHHHKKTFQPLCELIRETVDLRDDPKYEYRPMSYDEIRCKDPVSQQGNAIRKGVCEILDFSCIQLNGSIFLTRRPLDDPNACWESEIRSVAAGCECLWPKHENGDISIYHE